MGAAAEQYNIPKFSNDAMDVIMDPEVDAVWICSPSQFHADQIKACAAQGKHVFCEKPIATDLAETVEAINACNEAGVKLMIGLQRRFDQNFQRVKQAIDEKEVGDPIMIKLCSRDPAPPPASYVKGGGGIFADMAVHDLNMSRFIAGTDPIDILAIGSTHIDMTIQDYDGSEKYDTASCIVRYPDGVQAMIDVCRQSSFGYDQRAEVLGTKGMIQTDNVYPNTADKSAAENRWVKFSEIIQDVYCTSPTECSLVSQDAIFPEGFRPSTNPEELLLPDIDQQQRTVAEVNGKSTAVNYLNK